MLRRLVLSAASALLVAGTAAGCVGSPAPVATTPAFASEDEAFAAAEQTYRSYVDALNQVDLADPATFEPVFALTTGDLNATDRTNFSSWHAAQYQIRGSSSIRSMTPIRATVTVMESIVELETCYDVRDVDVVDASGASIVDASRPDIQALRVRAIIDAGATQLKITSIEPATEAACSS